ncbi:leucine-rich repeat domain-containing protein [Flammeovirga aprica]|uniref:Leucine-rich repeat domain-containing protein n=1 Tax=Flammeovirga aprica JL-4 TaxID=694437 RepID=A0A7X9S1L2_9BACT|nr:leucine-rich repeat domain-containing protein [Flammeovirga aprica]NME72487.1 hypothetical protein [Flammeovirga aprica JL-4]
MENRFIHLFANLLVIGLLTNCTDYKNLEYKKAIDLIKKKNFEEFGYVLDDKKENVIKIRIENTESLTSFPEELRAFQHLEEIKIKYCNLNEIPEFITEFTNLKRLIIEGNPITEIPEYITECKKLHVLDIENTDIKELPNFLKKLPLTGIQMKGSKVHGFPKILYEYDSLRALSLNELDELPADINTFNLNILYVSLKSFKYLETIESLEILDLSDSKGASLPKDFGKLKKLKDLTLRNCKNLVKLPESIGNIRRFWGLILGGCSRLTALPQSLTNSGISVLHLDSCYNLRTVPKGLRIGSLTANYTKWKSIPNGIFYSSCQTLKITDHQITNITGISNMYNLTSINLSRGKIKKIPDEIGRLKKLRLLLMEHNDIKEYPRALSNCPNLKSVRLFGNPVYDMSELNDI